MGADAMKSILRVALISMPICRATGPSPVAGQALGSGWLVCRLASATCQDRRSGGAVSAPHWDESAMLNCGREQVGE